MNDSEQNKSEFPSICDTVQVNGLLIEIFTGTHTASHSFVAFQKWASKPYYYIISYHACVTWYFYMLEVFKFVSDYSSSLETRSHSAFMCHGSTRATEWTPILNFQIFHLSEIDKCRSLSPHIPQLTHNSAPPLPHSHKYHYHHLWSPNFPFYQPHTRSQYPHQTLYPLLPQRTPSRCLREPIRRFLRRLR